VLGSQRVDHVLDVGANDGGFAGSIRRLGYTGRILSCEPLTEPFRRLARAARADDAWEVRRTAVGAGRDPLTMNVAGNDQASSSVLAMLDRHREAAPDAAFVGTEQVEQTTVDDLIADLPRDAHIYVKIDVQGYERHVLEGAAAVLPRILGLQLEVSFVPLYSGAWTSAEALAFTEHAGFRIAGVQPGFTDLDTGEMLQADFVFLR
jgi:FkbM family methyltransferase